MSVIAEVWLTVARSGSDLGMSDVTVVIATRNRRTRLADTLVRHSGPTILVDNGSEDGTPEYVEKHFPSIRVVRIGHNAGAAARNVGVQLAGTPFVAFADDDSYWADGALTKAAAVLRAYPRTGLVAATVLVGPDGRIDPTSADMAAAPLGCPPGHAGPAVLGFLACGAVVRREAFLGVGGFAAALGMYGEEALLAMDLAVAGWTLSYVPELVAHHLPEAGGRDPEGRRRIEARNRVLTALLRRPPDVVARTVAQAWREPAGRHGVVAAVARLPWALRNRRTLPPTVEAARAWLDRLDAGRPV
jgi:N-acetylglucosaminyl-diphospho-decaprenol L-rhamnosyltransferase